MLNPLPGNLPASRCAPPGSYHVELPLDLLDEQGELLDWVIGFAFDTLAARHLDLRIVAGAPRCTKERE
jgi:hypothetical protein